MKAILKKPKARHILFAVAAMVTMICTTSCEQAKDEKVTSVDLRYDAKNDYTVNASAAQEISFVVKSTDTWKVYSRNSEWCEITPSTGGPNEKVTVKVNYKDNTNLDDRVDTLVIQSSYWIGKWVSVLQKGTAYLSVDQPDHTLDKAENHETFKVIANQKWTTVVKKGDTWLTITSGASGELDGDVKFTAKENKGEKRYGTIAVLDRHGVERAEVNITQDGLQLDPAKSDLRILYNTLRVELPVTSNATWIAVKDDAKAEWYSFESDKLTGSTNLVITLQENSSPTLRKSTFTLKTEPIEGIEPVQRQIVIQQAFNNVPVRYYFDDVEKGKWRIEKGTPTFDQNGVTCKAGSHIRRDAMAAGHYTFYIKSMSPEAYSQIFFLYPGGQELRWNLDALNKKTASSTTPWTNQPGKPFDPTVPNRVTLLMADANDGYTRLEWKLNDTSIYTHNTTNPVLQSVTWLAPVNIQIGSFSGTVVYEWYEYTPPIIWD